MKKLICLLAFLASLSSHAGSIANRALELEGVDDIVILKGQELNPDEKESQIASCFQQLYKLNPDYPARCEAAHGILQSQGSALNHLTGATVRCSMDCLVAPIPAGRCEIVLYEETFVHHKEPKYVLETKDSSRKWLAVQKITGEVNKEQAVELLTQKAQGEFSPQCGE